jgi:hypothetical protein
MRAQTSSGAVIAGILRLRGYYALIAGCLLLFAVPLYQLMILAPSGYTTALAPAVEQRDFAPLLGWLVDHLSVSRGYRLLQLAPFLLALTFPYAITLLPGMPCGRRQMVMVWAGRIGFAFFALALVLGFFTSANVAAAYASAISAAQRAAVAASYANAYAIETLLAHVAGGLLVALFLALASHDLRSVRSIPAVFRLFGFFIAALLAITALFYALAPGQVEAPTSTVTFFGLALWFIALGVVFLRKTQTKTADGDESQAVP